MSARVSIADERLRARAIARRDELVAAGTNLSEWAREHGFTVSLVHNVLSGRRSCRRGDSHRIAVALGIKRDVTLATTPTPPSPSDLEPAR